MGTTLSIPERAELAALERAIERGLQTFLEVAHALQRIREKLLYRETDQTFEAYCRRRWRFSATQARRLIAGATAAAEVASIGTVKNEAQARELGRLPEKLRGPVFAEATAGGTRATTAATIQALGREALAALPPAQQAQAIAAAEERLRQGTPGADGRCRPGRSQAEARRAALKDLQSARRQLHFAGADAAAVVAQVETAISLLSALAGAA